MGLISKGPVRANSATTRVHGSDQKKEHYDRKNYKRGQSDEHIASDNDRSTRSASSSAQNGENN